MEFPNNLTDLTPPTDRKAFIKFGITKKYKTGEIILCEVLVGLDNYGFSTKFGWVNDQFGVSWQLNFGQLNFE